ncbi:MAG: PASTA domain-containing protein [Actinomycetota bacterium]|nr:PASTA domain-containing protein [Actinomycetota bacterium]
MGLRSARITVPMLVGLAVPVAHDAALDAGLLAVLEHPGPTVGPSVTAQYPPAGHRLRRGRRVRIWALPGDDPDGGGGSTFTPPGPAPRPTTGTNPRP